MAEEISQRAYARHRGVSHKAVQKAIAQGRITANGGKIDPAAADAQWEANTDQSKPRNSVSGRPKLVPPLPQVAAQNSPEPPAGNGATHPGGYAGSRAVRENYLARLAKLEYEERAGTLIKAADAEKLIFEFNRRARDAIMSIPDRVSHILAAETDPAEVHRILTREILRVCEELCAGI